MAFTTADEVIKYIAEQDIEYCRHPIQRLPGVQQHFSIPASAFNQDVCSRTARVRRLFGPRLPVDPRVRHDAPPATSRPRGSIRFRKARTLNRDFFVHDPFTREAYAAIPVRRRKAEEYLKSTGIADTAFLRCRAEFSSSTRSATTRR